MTDSADEKNSVFDLPPYQQRRFVPEQIDLTDSEQVAALYKELTQRSIDSVSSLEQFVLDRSELSAAVHQVSSVLYIRMTCQTDDPARSEAYTEFIQTVIPAIKPLEDQLDRKFIGAVKQYPLDAERYAVYTRRMESDIALFREENISPQTEDSLLSQEYQAVTGAMTVEFDGGEYPMPQMRKFMYDTDRDLRERAWRAMTDRRLENKDRLNEIYDMMISLRDKIGDNAGFENYRDYKFREYHRFDYTPDDCKQYHAAVEHLLVPIKERIFKRRAEQMGLEKLRPWDMDVDPRGRGPLKPFETIDEFVGGVQKMFAATDPEFGGQFAEMAEHGLLDLDSRTGKAPGGYQSCLDESRKPFIFMNAIGSNNDLRVLMHEGGHAFHSYACQDDPLVSYRHGPMEFCEVASMSMELIAGAQLGQFYDDDQIKRWWRDHLEGVVRILISVAMIDAFQHWVYENPNHTHQQRNDYWLELDKRFGSTVMDKTGLKNQMAHDWQRILHLYQVPFYYIEYGIAQLGALGMWLQYQNDPHKAIINYKKALALGGSRPLPELFAAAGLEFDFSETTIEPLAKAVIQQWETFV